MLFSSCFTEKTTSAATPYRAHRSISWASPIDDSGGNPDLYQDLNQILNQVPDRVTQVPISDQVLHQVFGQD